jgi:hypothetical protein
MENNISTCIVNNIVNNVINNIRKIDDKSSNYIIPKQTLDLDNQNKVTIESNGDNIIYINSIPCKYLNTIKRHNRCNIVFYE